VTVDRQRPSVGSVTRKADCGERPLALGALLLGTIALAACTTASAPSGAPQGFAATSGATASGGMTSPSGAASAGGVIGGPIAPLPAPVTLRPFPGARKYAGEGVWRPAGRLIVGVPTVYATLLVPPDGIKRAALAWMDTRLLSARLYSGSMSPGGGPYKYTAPVAPTEARSLVAAFNGGFKMADAHGGYYTEGRIIKPLVPGDASLVIYADGSITVGTWGTNVAMTKSVVAVRQNVWPLVVNGKPSALAATPHWRLWGGTCPCKAGVQGSERQWRSGLGVTSDGALVYVVGPLLDPPQLADLLVRAGVVRGMELDINPTWPVFASFKPTTQDGLATPSNGARIMDTYRGPATFFDPTYARDFITMSARPTPGTR
jgi:hypothetical protein